MIHEHDAIISKHISECTAAFLINRYVDTIKGTHPSQVQYIAQKPQPVHFITYSVLSVGLRPVSVTSLYVADVLLGEGVTWSNVMDRRSTSSFSTDVEVTSESDAITFIVAKPYILITRNTISDMLFH